MKKAIFLYILMIMISIGYFSQTLEAANTQNPPSMTVSKKSVITDDNQRTLVLHFAENECPPAGEGRPHKLTINAVSKTGATYSNTFDMTIYSPSAESLSATAMVSSISGLTVYFISSVSGGTSPYTYLWNFGDGSTSTASSPSHTYSAAGTFNVTLTVKDSSSPQLSATSSTTVTVGSSSTLTVTASASPISYPTAPVTIHFSSAASGGYSPYSYYWTFGDGGTSTLQNPSHIYSSKGIYTATVKVTDSHGQTATKSLTIKIGTVVPS